MSTIRVERPANGGLSLIRHQSPGSSFRRSRSQIADSLRRIFEKLPFLGDCGRRRGSIYTAWPVSLDAYDLYLRALSHTYTQTPESLDEAIRLLDKAIALDADYAFAKAFAAFAYALKHTQSWTTADDISKGGRLAHEALVSSRDEPTTIAFAAHALAMLTRDYDTALAAMDRAVYLNPNSAQILTRSAFLRTWVSDADRAIDEFSRSMRLSPADPEIGYTCGGLAVAFIIKGDYEKALEYAHRSAREMPRRGPAWRNVVVASVKIGRLQEAQEALRRVLLLSPQYSISEARRGYMFRDEWVREMYFDAYRKAGLPE
jgi:adenylate cyclase